MLKTLSVLVALVTNAAVAHAMEYKYKEGETPLTGYVALPGKHQKRVPGVLIIHQWMGLTDHERHTADELAKLGYVALAADIYGDGVKPKDTKEAGALAGKYKSDRALYRKRILAGLDALKAQPGVDPTKLAVIGFCFGGTGALEAARANMPIRGIVSFHGGLSTQEGLPAGEIKAKLLVCHGAADPFVPAAEVEAFKAEMKKAKADMKFIAYPGAVHAFTQKEAGNDPSKGAAYQEAAAKKSWEEMKSFFKKLF